MIPMCFLSVSSRPCLETSPHSIFRTPFAGHYLGALCGGKPCPAELSEGVSRVFRTLSLFRYTWHSLLLKAFFRPNKSTHGRLRQKSWTSTPKNAFSCGPGGGEKLFETGPATLRGKWHPLRGALRGPLKTLWKLLKTSESPWKTLKTSKKLWKPLKTLPLRDPLRGRFPSQNLSGLLPLFLLPLSLSQTDVGKGGIRPCLTRPFAKNGRNIVGTELWTERALAYRQHCHCSASTIKD